jgi:hypothetical protein
LVSIEMSDPGTFVPAKSNIDPSDEVSYRRRTYAALWLNYIWSMFDSGFKQPSGIRSDVRPFFESPTARAIWIAVRPFWDENLRSTRNGRRFMEIMDKEHTAALSTDPRPALPPYVEACQSRKLDLTPSKRRPQLQRAAILLIGIGIGALVHRGITGNRR